MDKITLDREVFKALASDTRLDILKALDVRQKTVTELARELNLNKATVFEHLEKLAEVGLIQKVETDVERKWVYWQLSWKGRRLLHPEAITLALALSTAGATLLSALAAVFLWVRSNVAPALGDLRQSEPAEGPAGTFNADAESGSAPPPSPAPASDPAASKMAPEEAPGQALEAIQHDPALLATAIVLGVLCLASLAVALWAWRKARQRTAEASGVVGG